MARLLTQNGYPAEWAGISLARLGEVIGAQHPMVSGLREFFTGYGKCIHLYSPPSPARQATFAVVLRGLLAKHKKVNIFDSADLAVEYFKKEGRREFQITPAPIIFTLGREMEKKVGAFFFRTCVEYAVSRKTPMALFTDYAPSGMQNQYFEFNDMISLASFKSFNV